MTLSPYATRMGSWENRASVRGVLSPREIEFDAQSGRSPFSLKLLAVANHRLVIERGYDAQRYVLAQKLYDYLDMTVTLEKDYVVPVANALADDRFRITGGADLAEDALEIAVDEEFHALDALRARAAVVREVGIPPQRARRLPPFADRLRTLSKNAATEDRPFLPFVFTCVSETLITAVLSKLPEDETVLPIVRKKVCRHALDEAWHHRVFAEVILRAWDSWSADRQARYAPWFAEFIEAFLAPDVQAADEWLEALGLTPAERETVINEAWPADLLQAQMVEACAPSLRTLRNAGLFECAAFEEALERKGLI